MMGMCLVCAHRQIQEQKHELKQVQYMRLLARRRDGKERRFEHDDSAGAWTFAGPDGTVLKWSDNVVPSRFLPMRWPESFMVFREGRKGPGNRRMAEFFSVQDDAESFARSTGGTVFERIPTQFEDIASVLA